MESNSCCCAALSLPSGETPASPPGLRGYRGRGRLSAPGGRVLGQLLRPAACPLLRRLRPGPGSQLVQRLPSLGVFLFPPPAAPVLEQRSAPPLGPAPRKARRGRRSANYPPGSTALLTIAGKTEPGPSPGPEVAGSPWAPFPEAAPPPGGPGRSARRMPFPAAPRSPGGRVRPSLLGPDHPRRPAPRPRGTGGTPRAPRGRAQSPGALPTRGPA